MLQRSFLVLLSIITPVFAGENPAMREFESAIRSNDLAKLRTLAADPEAGKVRGSFDAAPLHYAATLGSAESVRILLKAGADPNAKNRSGDTPLIFGAYDFEKTRALVEAGADVNAHDSRGESPLMIASSTQGNAPTVRYLIKHGADPKWSTKDDSPLLRAAGQGDVETLRLLLESGADPKQADGGGFTPLLNAMSYAELDRVNLLIRAGSDVNARNTSAGRVKNGPLALRQLSPLLVAVAGGSSEMVAALIEAGADVNAADCRKITPLVLAIATDSPHANTVDLLIKAGADVNARDANGESVLDWEVKFRNPEILKRLRAAGAKEAKEPETAPARQADWQAPTLEQAVARGSALMAGSAQVFFREGGCAGCHAQYAGGRVSAAAQLKEKNGEELWHSFVDGVMSRRSREMPKLPLLTEGGGDYDPLVFALTAMREKGAAADDTTDMYVHYLASRQDATGAWSLLGPARPPMEDSTIVRTAEALRVLRYYEWPARKAELEARAGRAVQWLQAAAPATSMEHAEVVLALTEAGATGAATERSRKALLAMQKDDGGWAQTPYLDSDAYATGMVLHDLYSAGLLKTTDPEYRRGVAFLLATQYPDGSWYVRSRAPKFQPFFEGGFPYHHDQWISSAGTALGLMALEHAVGKGS